MSDTPPLADAPGREPPKMSVGHAAAWAMAGQYASFAIMFATSVIISRFFLGPDEVGLFSIALSMALLLAVVQDFGITRYIAGLTHLDKEETIRCASVAQILSILVASLIALSAWPMARIYNMPELLPLSLIIAGSYLFIPLSAIPLAIMGRNMMFSGHFAVHVGGAVVHGSIALILAASGFSAFALAWATLASALTKGIIGQYMQPALPFPLKLGGMKPLIGFGSKTTALYIIGALGSRTPDMVVGKIAGLVAVGLFSRATSLADQFRMLISGAVGSVFYPAFARIKDRGESLAPAYIRVCAAHGALIMPGMAALALGAEPLVLMLFGEEWVGSAPLLSMVAMQSAAMFCIPLATELPILMGRINRLIGISILETILSVGLLIAGSYWGGSTGAAASRLVYALCYYILYMKFIRDVVGFRIIDWVAVMGKSAVVTLATIAPMGLAYIFWVSPSQMVFGQLLVCTIAGGLCWLLGMVIVRHPALIDLRGIIVPMLNRIKPGLGDFLEHKGAKLAA